ncbi:hypothetical protein CLV58_1481 [Spirosoma oryzae]|uniref:Uncharacterized protein n=1 Tax=Spirosoma oryzae TaxID=1469603 RepID=A0A2T0RLB2_9BACT|nr:hypothetical protein [Spirosoma oryzae]PRY21921.1 hypothetical protein CLV58_1481 [Spirosoma oryzae]
MTDQEAKNYIDNAFEKLRQITSIDGIAQLAKEEPTQKNRMNDAVYPALNFRAYPKMIERFQTMWAQARNSKAL